MRTESLLALVALAVLAQPVTGGAQVMLVPTFCDVTTTQKDVQAGARVTFTITLKNVKDQPVPAIADTTVTLRSNAFAGDVAVIVPKGHGSVTTSVTMAKTGVGRITATSAHWPPASATVLVRPANIMKFSVPDRSIMGGRGITPATGAAVRGGQEVIVSRGARAGARAAVVVPAATPVAQPVAEPAPAPPPALGIGLEIAPRPIFPRANVWKADVTVMLVDGDGKLATADRDVALRLFSQVGSIEPRVATIRAGDISADATLTSTKPGLEKVTVESTIAQASQEVQFGAADVANIRIVATPAEVVSDGRAAVQVAVILESADHVPTADATREIEVQLTSDLGSFPDQQSIVRFAPGKSTGETTLVSASYGTATISATSIGLTGQGTAKFLFPKWMLVFAVVGGLAGSLAREGFGKGRRRGGMPPWVRHLLLGALLGVVCYGLVLFGAIGSIPKLGVNLGEINPLNTFGAGLLGFLGGLVGNRFLAPSEEKK
jgi:hypothetical protein